MRSSLLKTLASAVPSLRWEVAAGSTAAAIFCRGYSKVTTGIVGLPVDENARQHLGEKLREVLEGLKVVPADAEYRRSLEAAISTKLDALASDAPDAALEERFGRQLEQEIKLCRDELSLLGKMVEWAPWDVPAGHAVETLEERDVEEAVGGGAAPGAPPPPPK
jgi:hypothetical protein